jgi:hypothetical protein
MRARMNSALGITEQAPEDAGTTVAANPRSNAGANADGGEPKGGTTKAPRGPVRRPRR